jgi:hypothetical protein
MVFQIMQKALTQKISMSPRILHRRSHICTSLTNYFDKTITNYYLGNMHVNNCTSCKYTVCNKQLHSILWIFLGPAHTTEKINPFLWFWYLWFSMIVRIILEQRPQTPDHGVGLHILKVPAFEEAKVACIPMYLNSALTKAKRMAPY